MIESKKKKSVLLKNFDVINLMGSVVQVTDTVKDKTWFLQLFFLLAQKVMTDAVSQFGFVRTFTCYFECVSVFTLTNMIT